MIVSSDTIAARATPLGQGGVGIIRVSGPLVSSIAQTILKKTPKAHYINFCNFFSSDQEIIDQGLALYFRAPHSFTGEDVLELHCHGGAIIIDILLKRVLELGSRIAKPGEFTQRAFLNNKIDLAQAEAVADLINATTYQAAQNAVRSLQGEFSKQINKVLAALIKLRARIELTIDFPEEDEEGKAEILDLNDILLQIRRLKNTAKQGVILRDGITVVIAGEPNAGKSSLFNYLSGHDAAIVTDIPGTTRDVLYSYVQIDGIPINLLDTAGLREQPDVIESEGIRRALEEIKKADHVLLMIDGFADANNDSNSSELFKYLDKYKKIYSEHMRLTILYNKIDLLDIDEKIIKQNNIDCIFLSVKKQKGLDLLKQHLKDSVSFNTIENGFSARRRHLDALDMTEKHVHNGQQALLNQTFELAADDLACAQRSLGEITGEFTADDLLEKIFSEFCIGK